ncbi:TonB-dependent receptor [Tahibacter aquaticus]|uniref:TonB-dependent receptor n=1 Tax=Tahibacter aquaticus TaxID=520092 RepID=UPI001414E7AA|nr:TonB-dependent receptor [Tahibacter aquaticus]
MKNLRQKFAITSPRRLLFLALGLGLSSLAYAQSNTVGSIYGSAKAGATINVESVDTGQKREVSVDANGRYRVNSLPAGKYRVSGSAGGGSEDQVVTVSPGVGTELNLAAGSQELETIQVTAAAAANPVDVSSVELVSVIRADMVNKLPVARDISSTALLTPGTVQGDSTFGNLASFGGASVAENVYYINGFNVTNIRNGIQFTQVPYEAVESTTIKNGGYGAEFGRSTGGVIDITTRHGTNRWEFGANTYWQPKQLRESSPNVYFPDGRIYIYNEDDESSELYYNAFASGPLIKDRLFIYALYQGNTVETSNYANGSVSPNKRKDPLGLFKLDWIIADRHRFELTALTDERTTDYTAYKTAGYSTQITGKTGTGSTTRGGENYIGKYTANLTDDFSLSASYGYGKYSQADASSGGNCPYVIDARGGTTQNLGCWVSSTAPSSENADTRKASRIDLEWHLGDHSLRGGLDNETILTVNEVALSGGIGWRYIDVVPGAILQNGTAVPVGVTQAVRTRVRIEGGSFESQNTAQYLEDNWQVTDRLLAYIGVRNETFDNRNDLGQSFIKADRQIAPRLGLSWDVNGDSSAKIYGTLGRYHLPIPTNINYRVAGSLTDRANWYVFDPATSRIDPVTGVPTSLGAQIGGTYAFANGIAPDPRTVAAQNIRPMYQDELTLGYQQMLSDNWSLGLRGVHRRLKSMIEDTCQSAGIARWAEDNGYTNFSPDSLPPCILINPGFDASLYLDINGDGNLSEHLVPARYFGLPRAKRNYNALEVSAEHAYADNWYLQASYTWSRSYGNTEGFVRTDNGQIDAGNTTSFDRPGLMDGGYGVLPNDHRHLLKAHGFRDLSDEWRLGFNWRSQSGRPLNCFGVYPEDGADPEAAGYGAASFYCGGKLQPRGSKGRIGWTHNLDLGLQYTPRWGDGRLTLSADVFNVFNWNKELERQETAETDDRTPNPSYMLPLTYQAPRMIRFSARYLFSL